MILPYKQTITTIIIVIFTIPTSTTGLTFSLEFPTLGLISYERAQETDDPGSIQLTRNLLDTDQSFHFGRATCSYHLRLWAGGGGGSTADPLTSFDTSFTFAIFSSQDGGHGGGMAFFLAPKGSKLPPAALSKSGATLGLTADSRELNPADPFVAVEFDVFSDYFDPAGEGPHVGINVNSMRSVVTAPWAVDTTGTKQSQAWISYNATSHNLSVVVTGHHAAGGSVVMNQSISHIVDLKGYLPASVTVGFSGSTGNKSASQSIYSWDFDSSLVITPTGIPLLVGLVAGSAFIAVVCLICVAVIGRRSSVTIVRDKGNDNGDDHRIDELLGPRKLTFKELARATNGFSDRDNKLGEGGFGRVYRGRLRLSDAAVAVDVAVKRVSRRSSQGMKEFAAEVKIISRLRHRNLVQLIGWCHEKKELLLVYEFLSNATLDAHLFNRGDTVPSPPGWGSRYKIAKGIAAGLLYLHEDWEQCVVHRDIKSSNVLLDPNFNPKLGDFGLARLVDHEKGSQTTLLAGTMGYMAPECATTGKASRESDVYSFGVVALEIATGRRPAVVDDDDELYAVHLVRWVWELHGSGELLKQGPDSRLGGEFEESEMERLLMVGMACAHPNPDLRLSARQALQVLNFDSPLPLLPLNMPVPTYVVSGSSSSNSNLYSSMSSGDQYGSSGGPSERVSSASTAPLRLNASRSEVLVLPSSTIDHRPVTV